MEPHDNPVKDEICCERGLKRSVKCRYDGCFHSRTTCAWCFIENHKWNPFHWALQWDYDAGIWVKEAYCRLIKGEDIRIHVGHGDDGQPCPWSTGGVDILVTHTNGIHDARFSFCDCPPKPAGRVKQLLSSQLFPATPTEPRSAFTFAVLKQFRMHNYQSKCGAFDYIKSLRRFTNNVITKFTPVSISFT